MNNRVGVGLVMALCDEHRPLQTLRGAKVTITEGKPFGGNSLIFTLITQG